MLPGLLVISKILLIFQQHQFQHVLSSILSLTHSSINYRTETGRDTKGWRNAGGQAAPLEGMDRGRFRLEAFFRLNGGEGGKAETMEGQDKA